MGSAYDFEILGDYILREKLGESLVSKVWKANHRSSGDAVVLKQIAATKLTSHLRNYLVAFLSSVNHPNIIRLLHFFKYQDYVILVMEFCEGGNLASFIRLHGRVQQCLAKRFMQQLGNGPQVLKQNHIVHRDLKPENILLSGSEYDPVLKIADFGLSRILLPDDSAQTVCGSVFYMAPEILQFQRYNHKVDMWSVGAILFELLNGYPPFHGRSRVQLLQNIKKSTSLPFAPLILPQLHPDCVDLCSRLLSISPDGRLSFEEFYQHNFLNH
ncbi:serine/threonine-protein kinase ATG1t-like [Salvia splendens]|uniref:serine/threonine-protein kinase ATG1t-like n=1 Tax=Salvia splendens TaxID=180675 RepID=UPI001C26C37E|nr:serine/threonine-protein kinase ATG1t-like [Salvia splendens]